MEKNDHLCNVITSFHPIYIASLSLTNWRENMRMDTRDIVLILITSMFLLPMVPPVTGDGMPVYTYVKDDEEARTLYSSTFESRQLANVELLNSTHQRIDLFLSIFSLEPTQNLTVLVPFREKPLEVSMTNGTDSDFLDENGYDRIKDQWRKQDLKETSKRFGHRMGNSLKDLGTCTTTTPLGLITLHVAESYSYESGGGKGFGSLSDEASGGDDVNKEVKEVSHYQFDGATVTIYSVSANATLEDFISVVDLGTLPTITREVVEEYKDQYVAVIDSMPSPPINEVDYKWLNDAMPRTMEALKVLFRSNDRISYTQAYENVIEYCVDGLNEMVEDKNALYNRTGILIDDNNYLEDWGNIDEFLYDDWVWRYEGYRDPFDLRNKIESLIFAVYGFTDFEGNTLSVTTELNEGKLYFPLGTSKGWDNSIADTIIIMKVGEERSLDLSIDTKYSAFVGDDHCYIVEYFHANPGEDLEADIEDVRFSEKVSSSTSKFIHYNTSWFPIFGAILLEVLLWFFLLWAFSRASRENKNMKVATGRHLLMGTLGVMISAPVTYIIFVRDPFSGRIVIEDKDKQRIYNLSFIAFFSINSFLFIWRLAA